DYNSKEMAEKTADDKEIKKINKLISKIKKIYEVKGQNPLDDIGDAFIDNIIKIWPYINDHFLQRKPKGKK
ncbi:16559_t:CDS:2, partial [Gigaspora margarita]